MVNSRNKGNDYERKLAKEFRELGFCDCCTSRAESKTLDDMGVDLANTDPWFVQAKCYRNFSGAKIIETLKRMPKDEKRTNILMLKITNKGEVVSMMKKDFYKLINHLQNK